MSILKSLRNLTSLSIIALGALFMQNVAWAEVDVIVHSSVSETASASDIQRVFLGKTKSLAGGTKVVPINLSPGQPVRDEFDTKVLGKSSSQLKAYWSRLVFTGKGQPPKDVGSPADVVNLVKSNPNMIGYVPKGEAGDGVKVIASF